MSDVPIHCGACGEELDELGGDHKCAEGMAIMAAVQTGDAGYLDTDTAEEGAE